MTRGTRVCAAFLSFGLTATVFAQAPEQAPRDGTRDRRTTIQSELDYLQAAKRPISVELMQATIRQTYDRIAGIAHLDIAYEGAVNADSKHDLAFKDTPLKDVLDTLGTKLKLTYRVDGPNKLTVVGAKSK